MKTVILVVPCKNEAHRLDPDEFLRAIAETPGLSFLFVDDGSTDDTAAVLSRMAQLSPSIDALYLPENRGKAEATRAGILSLLERKRCDLLGFWDADLATPLEEVGRFVEEFECDPRVELVIGSRWPHLGAEIDRSGFRKFTGWAMKFVIKMILRAPIYDTQCGAKIFGRRLAEDVFARPFLSPWLFDVEMLHRMGASRIRRAVREVPLRIWRDVAGSKMTLAGALKSVLELFKILFDGNGSKMVNY